MKSVLAGALLTVTALMPAVAQDSTTARSRFIAAHYNPGSTQLTIEVKDSAGKLVHRALVTGVTVDGGREAPAVTLDAIGDRAIAVTFRAKDGREHDFELALASDDETAYYGGGERFHALNHRGYILPMITDDRYGNKGVGSYKPVPFIMSSRGFGFWLDSFRPSRFDLSATERFTSRLRVSDEKLRIVFIAGPSFADMLDAYTALTGRTRVPPPWAFGLWKSRDVHHNQDSVLVDVERLRNYGIPASVLVIDSPWETGYNTFDVNRTQFPDADRMFARIRELGFELCLWLTPFVNDSNVIDMRGIEPVSANFEAARPFLVKDATGNVALSRWWKGRGGLVDFTAPAAVSWWHEQLRKTKAYGARAFKVDDGEGNFVPDARFADGSDARAMKNRYAVLYDSVMQAYVDNELNGNGVLIVRSGYTGMQRFPFAWAGDNRGSFAFDDGLPSVILSGLNAALSGISLWGSDIAGYAGRPDKEVFIRWTQFATFSPFMQVHMTSNLGPWDFDAETLEIFRNFARLRMRLFPYLYDAAHASSKTGMPIMRPMALAFQHDRKAAEHPYQYMFGPDLLVAPMYQPGTRRSVYLPAGDWIDFWSRRSERGGRIVEVDAPLARIPLFVRAGAVLPLLSDDVQTLLERTPELRRDVVALDDRRVIQVWPGETGALETWDGLSLRMSRAGKQTVLQLSTTTPRPIELRLIGRRLPALTVADGVVSYDEDADETRIVFDRFSGRRSIEWSDEPRLRYTINDDWRFNGSDLQNGEGSALDDNGWSRVSLPHTWNADDAFSESLDYRRGIGWYRKHLVLDTALRGKRLFLHFEGANQIANVYVNGKHAGNHIGGYTAFAFDITDLVHFDRTNLIAVRVDNRHNDHVPPLNADFTFYGGIYRDVWLIATDPVHITTLDHASPGVFIDTPEINAERATVRVRGSVVNASGRRASVDVISRVIDERGAQVALLRSRHTIEPRATARFLQRSKPIVKPRLWSPAEPNLYRVVTEVRHTDVIVDRIENPLGFRWFSADAQKGFSLNGKPLRLYGTNRHQDRHGFANALPDSLHRADVRNVKATGFNFLRLAHYPQDPAVLAEMDRSGLVGWEEIPVVNIISLAPEFADNAERMLVEMIRQHYNHPSVLFWGYMNEVLLRKPNPMPADYLRRVRELAERLDARAHAEDSTRATVMAISIEEIDDGSGMQDVSDVLGFNLYFGWYYRELDGLGAYLDSLHARNPTRPLMVSEYGADSDERIHTYAPVAFDFSIEHQQRFHEIQFPQMQAREYLIGTAVWNQFDFGSKGRHDSKPNLNQKGLLYFDRTPKDIWYYYAAALADTPVVHIAARDWPHRAGSRPADAVHSIVVYSNQPEIELLLNGKPLGSQPVSNSRASFSVTLSDGTNHLAARTPGGRVDEFSITYEDRTPFFADASSQVHVIAVNAGSHYQYIDAAGVVWEADRAYEGAGWGYVGGSTRLTHRRIFGTDDHALYQHVRLGAESYRFNVPDGRYEAEVHFVDATGSAAKKKIEIHARGGAGIVVPVDATNADRSISGILVRRL